MYKRKIPLDLTCGVSVALETILSKWKFCILLVISQGAARPKDMLDAIPDITKRVLHQQLKELEYYGFVNKISYPEVPPRVEYALTDEGIAVLPLLTQVDQWGLKFAPIFEKL